MIRSDQSIGLYFVFFLLENFENKIQKQNRIKKNLPNVEIFNLLLPIAKRILVFLCDDLFV